MKEKIIKVSLYLLLFSFLFVYIIGSSGLYEYRLNNKKTLTEDAIKKFETDVKNGVKIDLNDYIVVEKNYDNELTRTNRKISNYIGSVFKKAFKYLFRYIGNNWLCAILWSVFFIDKKVNICYICYRYRNGKRVIVWI